jgi:hypothetical protein
MVTERADFMGYSIFERHIFSPLLQNPVPPPNEPAQFSAFNFESIP